MTHQQQERLNQAVLYALRSGCFFPVPEPTPPYHVADLIKWGAMRYLHSAIADAFRAPASAHPQGEQE